MPRYRAAMRRRLPVLVVAALLTLATCLWMDAGRIGGDVLRLQLAFGERAAAEAIGDHPVGLWRSVLLRDYAFLAAYWLPLLLLVRIAEERYGTPAGLVAWAPIGAALLDAAENAMTLLVLDSPPDTVVAVVMSLVSSAKWILVLLPLVYFVRSCVTARR